MFCRCFILFFLWFTALISVQAGVPYLKSGSFKAVPYELNNKSDSLFLDPSVTPMIGPGCFGFFALRVDFAAGYKSYATNTSDFKVYNLSANKNKSVSSVTREMEFDFYFSGTTMVIQGLWQEKAYLIEVYSKQLNKSNLISGWANVTCNYFEETGIAYDPAGAPNNTGTGQTAASNSLRDAGFGQSSSSYGGSGNSDSDNDNNSSNSSQNSGSSKPDNMPQEVYDYLRAAADHSIGIPSPEDIQGMTVEEIPTPWTRDQYVITDSLGTVEITVTMPGFFSSNAIVSTMSNHPLTNELQADTVRINDELDTTRVFTVQRANWDTGDVEEETFQIDHTSLSEPFKDIIDDATFTMGEPREYISDEYEQFIINNRSRYSVVGAAEVSDDLTLKNFVIKRHSVTAAEVLWDHPETTHLISRIEFYWNSVNDISIKKGEQNLGLAKSVWVSGLPNNQRVNGVISVHGKDESVRTVKVSIPAFTGAPDTTPTKPSADNFFDQGSLPNNLPSGEEDNQPNSSGIELRHEKHSSNTIELFWSNADLKYDKVHFEWLSHDSNTKGPEPWSQNHSASSFITNIDGLDKGATIKLTFKNNGSNVKTVSYEISGTSTSSSSHTSVPVTTPPSQPSTTVSKLLSGLTFSNYGPNFGEAVWQKPNVAYNKVEVTWHNSDGTTLPQLPIKESATSAMIYGITGPIKDGSISVVLKMNDVTVAQGKLDLSNPFAPYYQ